MNLLEQDPQPANSEYRIIPLTKGQFATVDAADYESLTKWSWHAKWDPHTRSFYACRSVSTPRKMQIRMHVQIAGKIEGMQVDHRDGDTLNNRRGNLRHGTHAENQANRGPQRNNKSGFKGVHWSDRHGAYLAQIQFKRKVHHLGRFADPKEAHNAYLVAAAEYFGEFSRGSGNSVTPQSEER